MGQPLAAVRDQPVEEVSLPLLPTFLGHKVAIYTVAAPARPTSGQWRRGRCSEPRRRQCSTPAFAATAWTLRAGCAPRCVAGATREGNGEAEAAGTPGSPVGVVAAHPRPGRLPHAGVEPQGLRLPLAHQVSAAAGGLSLAGLPVRCRTEAAAGTAADRLLALRCRGVGGGGTLGASNDYIPLTCQASCWAGSSASYLTRSASRLLDRRTGKGPIGSGRPAAALLMLAYY